MKLLISKPLIHASICKSQRILFTARDVGFNGFLGIG